MIGFVPESEFDFSVHIFIHVVAVKPGQSASIPVLVEIVRGMPRPILLTTSDWRSAGLSAEIIPSIVPSGGIATLNVTVPANAAPGSYPFTVRGEIKGGGTFKTSNDSVTVIVEPEEKKEERKEEQKNPDESRPEQPAIKISKAQASRRFPSPSTKARARGAPNAARKMGGIIVIVAVLGFTGWYVSQLYIGSDDGSFSDSGTATYTGPSTFCINSAMGGAPECSTSYASVQIDSSGDVLGPVLFGKINYANDAFSGEAHTQDGTNFPMTGTFSDGTLTAQYTSNSVSWTIELHRQ